MKLEVTIEKDKTGYYVAEVPALPGCFTQGKTLSEVTDNIKEAIEGWIEVMNQRNRIIGRSSLREKRICKRIAVNV